MPPNISLRHYLRWLPDPIPSEDNTTTIVTTSPQNRFVDLRVFKQSQSPAEDEEENQPLSRLEWGLAGTSSSTPAKGPNGEAITHGVWKHWIDSRSADADGVEDEGDNYSLPNGLTLEKGAMVNPATGKVTSYEEVWEDVEVKRLDGKLVCVVLQLHDDATETRGLVVRVGQYCQGIARVGSLVAAERWSWSEQDGWKRTVKMGTLPLPCDVAMKPVKLELGAKLACGQFEWIVLELSET